MATLSELDRQARRLILELQQGVTQLDAAGSHASSFNQLRPPIPPTVAVPQQQQYTTHGTHELAESLRAKLSELVHISREMEDLCRQLVSREPPSKRVLWKKKVETVADEVDSLKMAMDMYSKRETRRQLEQQQRQELYNRCYGNGGDASVHLTIRDDVDAKESAIRSNKMVNEALEHGARILESMSSQRDRLLSVQRRIGDALGTIGLSRSLLRVIDRRHRGDQYLVYGLMLVTLIVLGLLVYFVL